MQHRLDIYDVVDGEIAHKKTLLHNGSYCITSDCAFYVNYKDGAVVGLGDWCMKCVAKTDFYLLSVRDVPKMLIHVDSSAAVRKATDVEVDLFNGGISFAEQAIPSVNFILRNFLKIGAVGLVECIKDGLDRLRMTSTAC